MRIYIIAGIVGLTSGILSNLALNYSEDLSISLVQSTPGLIFAIAFIIYLYFALNIKLSLKQNILWIIASIISWEIAFVAAIFISQGVFGMGIGGFIGASLLSIAYSLIIKSISVRDVLSTAIVGFILSAAGYITIFFINFIISLVTDPELFYSWNSFVLIFIAWQCGMFIMFTKTALKSTS